MDGVLWHDDEPIGDLPEIFSAIDRMALKVTFATNNATKSVSEFLHKLANFGVKVHPEQLALLLQMLPYDIFPSILHHPLRFL